jgi:hypothetical protein
MLFAFPQFPPQREWAHNSSELWGKELRNANWKGGAGGKTNEKFAICCKMIYGGVDFLWQPAIKNRGGVIPLPTPQIQK